MSPYSIEYRVRFNTNFGYKDRYFSEYADARSFITRLLEERKCTAASLYVLLMGPRGLFFSSNSNVLAEHYAYSIRIPDETLTPGSTQSAAAHR